MASHEIHDQYGHPAWLPPWLTPPPTVAASHKLRDQRGHPARRKEEHQPQAGCDWPHDTYGLIGFDACFRFRSGSRRKVGRRGLFRFAVELLSWMWTLFRFAVTEEGDRGRGSGRRL